MIVGISGANGVGKTTLAEAYAETYSKKTKCMHTSATPTFKRLGLEPSANLSFQDRMKLQQAVLDDFEATWNAVKTSKKVFVFDRTPLDLLAYTYYSIDQQVRSDEDNKVLADYTSRCIELLNTYFDMVFIVQPGIQMQVGREGKAVSDQGFVEHINTLIMGFSYHDDVSTPVCILPRTYTGFHERVVELRFAIKDILNDVEDEKEEYMMEGSFLH